MRHVVCCQRNTIIECVACAHLQEYPFPMSPDRFGAADKIVGSWLKGRDRSSLIIATKVSWLMRWEGQLFSCTHTLV